MTFRSLPSDFAPSEARRMYRILESIASQWDGQTVQSLNTRYIQEAADLVRAFKDRVRHLPSGLPDEFVLVHAPQPTSGSFDDWMQRHRATKDFSDRDMHKFYYSDYAAHPIRHLRNWASKQESGRGCYAYFVPHRTATRFYPRVPAENELPFSMHYNFAYPVFQTIDLCQLEIARGPYAGQHVLELFDTGPCIFLVKQVYYSPSSMQKYRNRRSVVYATWIAHLAPPYGKWRGHVL